MYYSRNGLNRLNILQLENNRHDLRYNIISYHAKLAILMKKKINVKGALFGKIQIIIHILTSLS